MKIALIAALSKNRVIGKQNELPWHLPADLRHFKSLTTGKSIIMGRSTFQSIGKALPNRQNIILTRDENFIADGCTIVHSMGQALEQAEHQQELMIVGGTTIYQQFLPIAQMMYLTLIDEEFDGDAYFPEWVKDEWNETAREDHNADEKNALNYSFVTLERKS